ncbi:MAG: hypothetical protein Edafosvirus36_16 [Edafosvirus sp.]|uniref:Uncharacterized protein n=1 Tax=Edafosvirus sp. TaxID=2487765 RepID=A0A3G4ZVB4_9VIRU|nr:MAG: hypothetical protein Edafosvirus36_16 [Edafosvirus sp.]
MTSFVSPRGLLKIPIRCSTFIITFNKPLNGCAMLANDRNCLNIIIK